jgi:hypothetical protein
MGSMVRKQVYIERGQEELLKAWADETGRTEADIVREALDRWMAREERRREAEAAWGEERTFIEARIAEGPLNGGRGWTRETLYENRVGCRDGNAD